MGDFIIDVISIMEGLFFIFVIIIVTVIIGKEMNKRLNSSDGENSITSK